MGTKGFITLATGNKNYYKTAANLLKSYLVFHSETSKYRADGSKRLPFAILADRENEYTELFDDVIILENPTCSCFDKISLLDNIPYDETIFIESDCLAYVDLNEYFEVFKGADDFSVIGRTVPTDSKIGWFNIEEAGKYKDAISFIPRFHSAVIYMKKSGKCSQMYNICLDINSNYDSYMIGGSPEGIDDKLLAVSSAAVGCKPTELRAHYYACYPLLIANGQHPKPRMHIMQNKFYIKEQNKTVDRAMVCHWGDSLTKKYLYRREVHSVNCILKGKSPEYYVYLSAVLYPIYKADEYFELFVKPKIIETLSSFSLLKKIWHLIKNRT